MCAAQQLNELVIYFVKFLAQFATRQSSSRQSLGNALIMRIMKDEVIDIIVSSSRLINKCKNFNLFH